MVRFQTHNALDYAIHRTAALNEAFAVLVSATKKGDYPLMSDTAIDGLMAVAMENGAQLRQVSEQLFLTRPKGERRE